jgi:hypothetical protein
MDCVDNSDENNCGKLLSIILQVLGGLMYTAWEKKKKMF